MKISGKKTAAGLLAASMLCTTASAATVGINTHWGHSNFVSPYIEFANDVNAEWVRDGLGWAGVEKTKGVYAPPHPEHGNMPYEAEKNGLGMVYVLGFGNCLYDGCSSSQNHKVIPYQGDYLEAWKNYVKYTATEYKGLVDVYEVWNEPDIGVFNSTNVTGKQYAELLKATKEVLDEVDPDARVAGAVVSNEYYFRWGYTTHDYLEEIFKNGGGDYMDIVSVHIYTQKFKQAGGGDGECAYTDAQKTPELAWRDWLGYFEASFDKYNFTKDVWLTEAGWYTGTSSYAVSEETQAKYLIRQAVLWEDYLKTNNRNGEMIFYQAKDSADDTAQYGVRRADGTNKEAYYSLKAYNTFLKDSNFESLTQNGNTYLAQYNAKVGTDKVYVAWNPNEQSTVNITLTGDQTNIYDYKGNLIESLASNGTVKTVTVGDTPVFIECAEDNVTIDSVSYHKETNVIKVTGRTNIGETVNVSLKKGSNVLETKTAAVTNHNFELNFAPMDSGNLTVYAGDTSTNDSRNIAVTFGEEESFVDTGALAVYNAENNTVNVSGRVSNYTEDTESTIAVVKGGKSAPYGAKDILHMGQTKVNGGNFAYNFKLSKNVPGKYNVILGGTKIDSAVVKNFVIPTTKDYFGYIDTSSVTQSTVSATANLVNYASVPKDATLIICQYDENMCLVGAEPFAVTVAAKSGDDPTEASIDGSSAVKTNARYFKAFIWENMTNMKPISEVVEL